MEGITGGAAAGVEAHYDISHRECTTLCEQRSSCFSFTVNALGSNWCETYTAAEATGDGRTSFHCWLKGDFKFQILFSDSLYTSTTINKMTTIIIKIIHNESLVIINVF